MTIHTWIRYALLSVLLFATPTFASNGLGLDDSGQAGALGLSSNEDSFLRVEEAYQVSITRLSDNRLALAWQIAPGYYLYQSKFKFKTDSGILQAEIDPGVVKYDEYFQKEVEVHYDQTRIVVNDLPQPPYQLQVTSQGCADAGLCYPPHKQLFKVTDTTSAITESEPEDRFGALDTSSSGGSGTSADGGLNSGTAGTAPFSLSLWFTSILLAMVGGIILNLMPCVFPVLSIKALSLTNSHQNNHRMHLHGWAYTAGCVATFVAIAAVMLALRASGAAVGWGFQLQSPAVIAVLLYVFFLMGLSFSGVINLGSSLMGVGQNATQGNKLHHSWMTGALASVVASPCTAPMMGAALGYAITQPGFIALSIFAALGFGMALPFLLLTYIPALAKLLPKPGAWMDTLKQALAFPMYLSCVWLLWVLANQTNSNHIALIASGLVLLAFAVWLLGHLPQSSGGKWLGRGVAAACVLAVGYTSVSYTPAKNDELWQAYSPALLAELRDKQQPVFINLTASWCITCIANERVALGTEAVRNTMRERGIQGLKGDWTNADPKITQLLNQYGRSGVPLYLYFPADPDAEAVILPQLLTTEIVIDTISDQDSSRIAKN